MRSLETGPIAPSFGFGSANFKIVSCVVPKSYAQKLDYVMNNPVRHGYVRRAKDWPYQGELKILDWHDQ
jgi:hypothetical protein